MSSARRPLPTDIVALVTFEGKVHANEAKPRDRLGLDERAHALEEAIEQWVTFALGKHTWLNVKGATIRGLVTVRPRAKRSVWEVEMLIDTDDDDSVVDSLFKQMVSGCSGAGAERLFLRVDADSRLVDSARGAGFFAYQKETLYELRGKVAFDQPDVTLRKRTKKDAHGLFQLYNRVAPANVRAIEGVTLREWQAAQEKWGGRVRDFLLEEDGVISAYLRTVPGAVGRVGILADTPPDVLDDLLRFGLARLRRSRTVLSLVPDHDIAMARTVTDHGFEPVRRYAALAKRFTQPVAELANDTAKKAVPVG